jgi:branched-chain amino acid transport system permease protein
MRSPLPKWTLFVGVILALLLPQILPAAHLRIVVAAQVGVIASIATTLLVGTAGQLSLAGAAFMAVGAFTGVALQESFNAPFFIIALAVPVAGALLGAFLALPALRLRGLYLVLSTLGFHYIVSYVTRQYEASRGAAALAGLILNPPEIEAVNWGSARVWYFIMLALTIGTTLLALNVRRSRFGRAWVALRERDIVATSLGVDVGVYKIIAFSLTSALLAVAGMMSSLSVGVVSSEYFSINLAIQILVMAVIGGLGSVLGAWLGAIFVVLLPHLIQGFFGMMNASGAVQLDLIAPIQLILFGTITIMFLLFEPAGLAGIWMRVRRYFQLWPLQNVSEK